MFNPARQLQTTPLSVSQLFERGFFVVPSNQRLYRWGENQWKKLWDDLITTIEEDFTRTLMALPHRDSGRNEIFDL